MQLYIVVDISDGKALSPTELHQQLDDIKDKVSDLTECICDLEDNNKRWLLVGISLNTVLSPALRKYVAPKLEQLWQTLKNSKNIDTQLYPQQLTSHLTTFLNYEAINNNKHLGLKQQSRFNYRVKDSVDLSKLFLQTNFAQYTGFDDSCDSSALLGIIIKTGICSSTAKGFAEKIREVRNLWAHCNYTQWNDSKYTEAIDLFEQFVRSLGLSSQEEEDVIAQLGKLSQNGQKLLAGTTSVILEDITKQIHAMIEHVGVIVVDTPADINKLKDELTGSEKILLNHSQRLKQLEEKTDAITGSITKLAEKIDEQDDSIPRHMKEKHQVHIEEWKQDGKTFTVTRATKYVAKLIKENDVVMVTGSSGTGKSSIIHHIALELQSHEGYDIIPFVTCPTDIVKYRDVKKKQVFVVDDICGKSFINDLDLQIWSDQSEKIEKLLPSDTMPNQTSEDEKHGRIKILVSCRLHIFKDDKFKTLKMFMKNTCNLQSEEHCLLPDERQRMIKMYTSLSESDMMNLSKIMQKYFYFPLICKMSKGKQVKQLTELFSSPIESIKNDIKVMIESKELEHCALVLCVLFQNGFDEKYLSPRTMPNTVKQKVIDIVTTNFEINLGSEMKRKKLSNTFKRLDGTYIKKTGSVYSIAHDKLYDMIAVTCGRQLVELFIQYAPSAFIAERFRFQSIFSDDEDSCIYLSEDIENYFFERMFKDLKEQDGTSFFCNQQLKEKRFKDKVMEYIENNKDYCNNLFLELDSIGVHQSIQYEDHSSTPLIEASKIGFYELVQCLISLKCNLNKEDSYGRPPLSYVCKHGFVDIVELFIKNDANIIQDALYYACFHGDINIMKFLLERNADETKLGRTNESLLFVACFHGHPDVVKFLIERNADTTQCNYSGDPLLYVACRRGTIEVVRMLLNCNVDVSQKNGSGDTSLYVACERGYINIVKLLLEKNADVSQCGRYSDPPLYGACIGGHIDIVKLLLEKKADVSQNGESGTPLCGACRRGQTAIVKLLLEVNADVLQCCRNGDSPLYVACSGGHVDIVKLLLYKNADVARCGMLGDTPLIVSCVGGHTEIVKLLLERNADVSQCGEEGDTPLFSACWCGHTEIVKLLLERNADVSKCGELGPPLYAACREGHNDIVKLLLERNADLTQKGWDGRTPFDVGNESIKNLIRNYKYKT